MSKTRIEDLPPEILEGIAQQSSDGMLSVFALSQTSLFFNQSMSVVLQVGKLNTAVIRGDEKTVVAMLRMQPDLMLKKSAVMDDVGRCFCDVSALQLAIWSNDAHMYHAILRCIPAEDYLLYSKKLYEQLEEQEDIGISYYFEGQRKQALHFKLENLLTALDNFIAHAHPLRNPGKLKLSTKKELWSEYSAKLILAPTCLIQTICNFKQKENMAETIKFSVSQPLLRTTKYIEYKDVNGHLISSQKNWFPLAKDQNSKICMRNALISSNRRHRVYPHWSISDSNQYPISTDVSGSVDVYNVADDYNDLHALNIQRHADLKDLKAQLLSLVDNHFEENATRATA